MAVSYEQTLQAVRHAIALDSSARKAWNATVETIAPDCNAVDLAELRSLSLSRDVNRVERWLLRTLSKEPVRRDIRGLWFGLYHPDRNGDVSCDFFLSGFREFEADSMSWLSQEDYRASRDPESRVLDRLYHLTSKDLYEDKPAIVHLTLWYALIVVAHLCRKHSAIVRGNASR